MALNKTNNLYERVFTDELIQYQKSSRRSHAECNIIKKAVSKSVPLFKTIRNGKLILIDITFVKKYLEEQMSSFTSFLNFSLIMIFFITVSICFVTVTSRREDLLLPFNLAIFSILAVALVGFVISMFFNVNRIDKLHVQLDDIKKYDSAKSFNVNIEL